MIPYIQIFGGKISSYGLMAAAGVLALVFSVHLELRKSACAVKEENFIYPRIVVSGMAAWFFSVFFDTLFKIRENGGFVISGSTFLRRPDRCDGKFVCSFENCKRQDRLFHNRMV